MSASDKSQRSVFVGNIPYDTSEEKLKDIFSEVGPVLSFRLVYDRDTGKPKGYGFCEYQDVETALSAMRNLNGYDINGRALRVDYATTEKNKEEMKALQLAQAPLESPFGDTVAPHEAPEAISKAVASLPPEQMFELMKQMKIVIQNNPVEARNMLLQNPQLAYALLQAQVVMRIVSPEVAMTLLHKQNDAPQPLLPPEQQPSGSSQNQPQPVAPPPVQAPQPIPPPQNQHQPLVAAQPNHGGRGPHGDMRGPEPGMVPQRPGPGPGMPGGIQGRQGPPQAGIPGLMQQQGGLNEGRFQDGRGPPAGPVVMNQGQAPSVNRQGPSNLGMMMMHPGEPGRGGIPVDHGVPMEQDPHGMPSRQGGMDPRGPMEARGGPMEARGGPMEARGGPMEARGGPMEARGGPMEARGGPMDARGGPMDARGGPMDARGGPMDARGGPMDARGGPMDARGGPMDARGGPMDARGGPMDARGGPMDARGGPMDNRGGPMDNRAGPMDNRVGPMDNRGGPMDNRGGPMDNRGGPMDARGGGPMDARGGGPMDARGGGPMDARGGGPMDGIDPRRQGFERRPEGLAQGIPPGGLPSGLPARLQLDPRAMQRGLPHLLPGAASSVSLPGAVPGQAQPTPQDQEKAALIMQVLGLSNEQINSLPQDQRQSILLLKEQLARSQNQMP